MSEYDDLLIQKEKLDKERGELDEERKELNKELEDLEEEVYGIPLDALLPQSEWES